MKLLRRLRDWLRPKMPVVNILLATGCYIANQYFVQGFCQPVPWAAWVLACSTGAFLAWPWLKRVRGLNYGLLFLQGALLLVCVYCTYFARPYLLTTLLFGFLVLPLLLWTPVIFGVQVLRRVWHSQLPGGRWMLAAGALPLLLAQAWALRQYHQVTAAVAMLPPNRQHEAEALLQVVPRNYIAERVAGRWFKYHNSPEFIYDGWRPPLHDPLVNICLWTQPDDYLLAVGPWGYDGHYIDGGINSQSAFYHQLFPNEPIKADCGCIVGGDGYYAWRPSLTDESGTPLAEVERRQKEFDAEMARIQAQADSARAASHP